jgi:hypothetical protein
MMLSCNKKDDRQHITIDADVVANFSYKVGSYWIYKDSLSGQVDSFYVYRYGGAALNNSGTLLDNVGIYIGQQKISGPGTTDTIDWAWGLWSNYISLSWTLTRFGQIADQIGFTVFISYPFSLGHPNGFYGGISGGNVTEILPKYLLNGNSYDSVAVLNYNGNVNGYPINDTYFINAKIGIVKMSLNHTNGSLLRVWELQRSNIVR